MARHSIHQVNVVWWKKILNEDDPDRDPEERGDFANGRLTTNHVYAPTTLAFPCEGWNRRIDSTRPLHRACHKQSSPATHRLTYLFTQPHINGARPGMSELGLKIPARPPIHGA